MKVRKFYSGLGELIQTQQVGLTLDLGTNQSVVVDQKYDAAGRLWKQTVPYATSYEAGFHTPTWTQAVTLSEYDVLGRAVQTNATDGTPTSTSYAHTADHRAEVSRDPVQGCEPYELLLHGCLGADGADGSAGGAGVDYAYNAAGQLTAVDYGGAVSSFTYNYAGMKTSMNDADMGLWHTDTIRGGC